MIFLSFSSCRVQNGNLQDIDKSTEIALLNDGYVKAIVLFFPNKGEECKFLIQLEDNQLLETFDLPDSFKTDSTKIWLKFGGQKRMSLCESTSPVAIIDIKKREE